MRCTSDHVRLAPVTPVTVIPEELASVATNASNNSLALDVENVGEVMLVPFELRSVEAVLSIPSRTWGVTVRVAVWLTPP